ncbi:MAG: hypothetical protein IIA91_08540 [Chloroflexi bacterium]|nr:hypothetical protein [Chloroflexota bacterium]
MKTRSILPFAVFGILFALLLAVSACIGGGGSGATPTPSPEVSPVGFDPTQFGGPYPFAPHGEEASNKERDFECYKDTKLSVSQAVKLTDVILSKYMEADLFDNENMQKYNYVIDMDGNVIVAQWQEDVNFGDFRAAQKKAGAKDGCTGRQCLGDGDSGSNATKEAIVNLISEDKKADPKQSPCWLDRAEGKGLLDAISKHFMLAQGTSDNGVGATIDMFNKDNENNWYEWTSEKVAYAGQIIVDLETCTLDVNGDSGTYRPKTTYRTLTKVAEQFASNGLSLIKVPLCPDGIKLKD